MIFDFKNLSAYGQALKITSTDVGELSKLTSNLTLAQTANALTTKNLTTQEMAKILVNKGLTKAEAEATAAKIASAKANGVATFSLNGYIAAIWESIKAIGVWMLTNPVGWVVGLGIAIGGTTLLLDVFTETIDEQKEKIKELKDEYTTLKEELEVLYDQIEKNKDIIDELQSKKDDGIITLVEEDQLRKLKLQNELLEQQYITNEKIKNQKKKELVEKNRTTFKNEFDGSVEKSASINSDISNFYTPGISSYEQAPDKNLILLAKENAKRLENALLSGDEDLVKLLDEDKKLIEAELSERFDTILLGLLEYQNDLSEIQNIDGTFDNPVDQQSWNDIESWKKALYKYTNQSGEWNTAQIKLALDTESLQTLKDELKARLDAGDLTEEDLAGFTDLNTALSEANLILEDGKSIAYVFLQYLLGIAASQDDVATTKPNYFVLGEKENTALDSFQEKISKVKEVLQGLDNKTISLDDVINISQEMGLDVNEIDMLSDSYEGLRGQLEQIIALEYDNLQEKLKGLLDTGEIDQDTYNQLSDGLTLLMLSSKNTNKEISSLSDSMSNLQSNFNSLTDAEREYEKTGKLSYETIQALSSAYPELEQELMDYLSGITTGETIIENLKESYDVDLLNYKAYYAEKHKNDLDFYNQILENIPENIKARFEEYKFDLENYKSLAEAKLQIEKNLADEIYKQKLRENDRPIVKPWINENYMFNEPEDPAILRKQAEEEAEELSNALDKGVELSINLPKIKHTGNNDNNSDNNEFSEEIDWIARSVENANREVEKFNNILENTNGFSAKIKVYEQLAGANQKLVDSTRNAADEYKDIWEDSASKIDQKYVDLITSSDSEILQNYNNALQERKKTYSGSKYAGNVDLYNRPILFDDEGYYETLKSETYNYSDFGINKEGAFNVTPILPDGTKIENLEDYILNQLKKGKPIEDLDVFMGGDYSSIDEAVEAAIALHEEQDEIYGAEASYLQLLKEVGSLDLSIESFTDEDTYNDIINAKELYDIWQDLEKQYGDALQQQKIDIEAVTSLLLEKEELALEILNIVDRENMSASKQNKLLEKEKTIMYQILQYNLALAKTNKEKKRLQKEYDEYLKGNDEQQYQNKRNKRSNKVSFYDTEIQDIQNEIDLSEAEGGQGTEQQYLDMNMLIDKKKSIYQKDYSLALEKRNGEKFGTDKWNQYNEEMQEAENGINDCTMAQMENNRAILLLPIHKLEEEKEALEEQLEIYKEKQSNLESAISGASNILQDEIDTYNDLKESISDSYDAQIKAINDKKDALTETNDALKEQMSLEQAQYNLDRALNQKTVKVIRNKQIVYEADARAIIDAQKQLDEEKYNIAVSSFDKQIKNLEDQKEDSLDGIDDQIKLLQDYKDKVDGIVGSYEKALEMQMFLTLFNSDGNGIQRLLNMDESLYGDMFNQYTDVSSDVTSTEGEIKTIDEAIVEIEKIAERWDGAKTTIKKARQEIEDTLTNTEKEFQAIKDRNSAAKTINKQWKKVQEKTTESLGLIETNQISSKDAEKPILDERLANIKTFSEEANGYLSSIGNSIPNISIDLPEVLDVLDVPDTPPVEEGKPNKTGDKKNNNKNGNKKNNNNKNKNKEDKEDEEDKKKKGKKNHVGMENGLIGSKIYNQDDTFQYITLTKLKPDEVPTVLQVGEGVLTKLQQTNVLDNMRTAFYAGVKLPNFNNIQKANNTTPTPSITLNGDIILQGVQDTENFAKKIKSEFLTKLSQELYK